MLYTYVCVSLELNLFSSFTSCLIGQRAMKISSCYITACLAQDEERPAQTHSQFTEQVFEKKHQAKQYNISKTRLTNSSWCCDRRFRD